MVETKLKQASFGGRSTQYAALLNFFTKAYDIRRVPSNEIIELFSKAHEECPNYAYSALMAVRDSRGGIGERRVFRIIAKWYADTQIHTAESAEHFFNDTITYGRWDDLWTFLDCGNPIVKDTLYNYINKQIDIDLAKIEIGDLKSVSYLGKWMPSFNASNKHRRANASRLSRGLKLSKREYKIIRRQLIDALDLLESKMSERRWSDIELENVPVRAFMTHLDALNRHIPEEMARFHNNTIRKLEYGEELLPHNLLRLMGLRECNNDDVDLCLSKYTKTGQKYWNDLLSKRFTTRNVVTVGKTSLSMLNRGIEFSVGTMLYFAQINVGEMENLVLTYNNVPKSISLPLGASLSEKVEMIPISHSKMDLEGALKQLLLSSVYSNLPKYNYPKTLIIITDEPIHDAMLGSSKESFLGEIVPLHEAYGYEVPVVLYVNITNREKAVKPNNINGVSIFNISGTEDEMFNKIVQFSHKNVEELIIGILDMNYDLTTP